MRQIGQGIQCRCYLAVGKVRVAGHRQCENRALGGNPCIFPIDATFRSCRTRSGAGIVRFGIATAENERVRASSASCDCSGTVDSSTMTMTEAANVECRIMQSAAADSAFFRWTWDDIQILWRGVL